MDYDTRKDIEAEGQRAIPKDAYMAAETNPPSPVDLVIYGYAGVMRERRKEEMLKKAAILSRALNSLHYLCAQIRDPDAEEIDISEALRVLEDSGKEGAR